MVRASVLGDLFESVDNIVKSFNNSTGLLFGFNYNYINGFTIFSDDEENPIDINDTTSPAYEISALIHEKLGGYVVVTVAPSYDYYYQVLANNYTTVYGLDDVATFLEETGLDEDDNDLFMYPQVPIEETLHLGKRLAHCESLFHLEKHCDGDKKCISPSISTHGSSEGLVNNGCCDAVWSIQPHHESKDYNEAHSVTIAGGYRDCRPYNIYSAKQVH